MLSSWTVENFKSIGGRLTLPLSPITILVGANSSGKSSIIQSMLLIKQTLQYTTADRPIALNGPLLKLGAFDDVRTASADGGFFSIGWRYDSRFMEGFFAEAEPEVRRQATNVVVSRDEVLDASVLVSFGLDEFAGSTELSKLQPIMRSCEVTVTSASHQHKDIPNIAYVGVSRATDDLSLVGGPGAPSFGPQRTFSINFLDAETAAAAIEDYPDGRIVGAVVRHFFPSQIAVKFDEAVLRATRVSEAIASTRIPARIRSIYGGTSIPSAVLNLLDEWANRFNMPPVWQRSLFNEMSSMTLSDLADVFQSSFHSYVRRRDEPGAFSALQELQPQLYSALLASLKSEENIALEFPSPIYAANNLLRRFFETYVRYLGPLRDQPKPLYPLEALGNPTDVGYRGEHTAAVLDLNRKRKIKYIPSKTFLRSPTRSELASSITTTDLKSAAVDWLSYMGVAEDIVTADKGKFGHELQVRTSGVRKFHDLTNVGVGVSQVLPIVLSALLAPPGSVLIFEQPELHLHPLVQTRLADFFISVSLTGKQCLLETHSEYLIHRLRRRIAEAPGEDLTPLSKLYFVERNGGQTTCRPIDITQFGAISDWPKDFFDQAQIETESILTAASVKRQNNKKRFGIGGQDGETKPGS